jgi:hypothetical protein
VRCQLDHALFLNQSVGEVNLAFSRINFYFIKSIVSLLPGFGQLMVIGQFRQSNEDVDNFENKIECWWSRGSRRLIRGMYNLPNLYIKIWPTFLSLLTCV